MIVFEQHNGNDIKRAIHQMLQHCDHLETRLLKNQYQLSENPIIYYVLEQEKLMAPMIKRLQKEPRILNYQQCFRLNAQTHIEHYGFNMD